MYVLPKAINRAGDERIEAASLATDSQERSLLHAFSGVIAQNRKNCLLFPTPELSLCSYSLVISERKTTINKMQTTGEEATVTLEKYEVDEKQTNVI